MDITSSAIAEFDAGHSIKGLARCAEPHGHHWTVTVTVNDALDITTGEVRGAASLPESLQAIAAELDRQNLDAMLPDVITGTIGLASYFLERLALRFPRLVAVRVTSSDGTEGEVRRTPRQL